VFRNVLTDVVVTSVLASVVLYEFVSRRLARNLLVDAEEIAGAIKRRPLAAGRAGGAAAGLNPPGSIRRSS